MSTKTIQRDIDMPADYLGTPRGAQRIAEFTQDLRDEFEGEATEVNRVEVTADHKRGCCVATITLTPESSGSKPVEPIGAADSGVDDGGDES